MPRRLAIACIAWLLASCAGHEVRDELHTAALTVAAEHDDQVEAAPRTAILFVHGLYGSAADWHAFAARLDRSRYEAWFFVYSTEVSVNEAARQLHDAVAELQQRRGVVPIVLTAHSLGGLVVRAFLLEHAHTFPQAKLFVSLSTPWGGEPLAELGVRLAPRPPRAWADLVPRSATLQRLFATPLAAHVRHVLFFGHKGRMSMLPGNRDGAVTLASQLDPRAQSEAALVVGFDEDHAGILLAPQVFERYAAVLDAASPPPPEAAPDTSSRRDAAQQFTASVAGETPSRRSATWRAVAAARSQAHGITNTTGAHDD